MELLISGLVGGLIGLLLGVIFEDALVGIRDRFLTRTRLLFRKPLPFPIPFSFALGPIETSLIVVDGDGETSYARESILCHYDATPIKLPPELEEHKSEVAAQQEMRKRTGDFYQWPGLTAALSRYRRGRSNDEEGLELQLWFRQSDWFAYLATNLSLDSTFVLEGDTDRRMSLREKYFRHYSWSNPNLQPAEYFSNTFGTVVSLITGDGHLLISKRADEIGSLPSIYNVAINETLTPTKDWSEQGTSLDLYKTVVRGAYEELNLQLKPSDITFLVFAVDSRYNMWGILGIARTEKTVREVVDLRRRGAKDKWEGQEILPVKFGIAPVVEFVSAHAPWSSGSIACTYFTLVHEFGKPTVDRVVAKHSFPLGSYVSI